MGNLPETPTLPTDRLVLRPLRLADTPVIQRRFPQWEIVRFLNARVPWPFPEDGAETNMRDCLEERAQGKQFFWAITLRGGNDELIGRIDLRPDDGVSRDMRGFWLDPEFHGQGLMMEAAEQVTRFAFEDMGWSWLFLTNAAANTASRRIKEKQGAELLDLTPNRYVSGDGMRETWILRREAWLAARSA